MRPAPNAQWISHPNLVKNDYAVIALRKTSVGTWCTTSTYDLGFFGTRSVGYTEETGGFVSGYPSGDTMPPGLSGYPHLDECDLFARHVLPMLDHRPLGLTTPPGR